MPTDFSTDPYSAYEAKSIAQQMAFSPFVFQATLAARNLGLLDVLDKSGDEGLCAAEISRLTGVPVYGVKVLLDMGLSSRIVRAKADGYALTKIGYYVLHDPMARVNFNFTNDVCYEALAALEASVTSSKPIPSSGRPMTPSITEIATRLAAGMPATPIDVSRATSTIENCWVMLKSSP